MKQERYYKIELELALAVCQALDSGVFDYFDDCIYFPESKTFKYCYNGGAVVLTVRDMIHLLNNELKDQREDIIANYCDK